MINITNLHNATEYKLYSKTGLVSFTAQYSPDLNF